jgi:predicted adenine nucleotide alpha hydrolase (AANH) superfamily ATPase
MEEVEKISSIKEANKAISKILIEAQEAFDLKVKEAEKIADEWGVSFSIGEYGEDAKYYIPNHKGFRAANEWDVHLAENYGDGNWYASNHTC